MPAVADSLASSATRPLALRARKDLAVRRHAYHGQPWWVIKEPLGLNYFRFQEEEYALLEMLDGQTSLAAMKQRFERRFAPQVITLDELHQFVGALYQSGLVVSDAAGQTAELRERAAKRRRREQLSQWTNPLSLRFRGFDPDRLLDALYPWVRWMYSLPALAGGALLIVAALVWLGVHFDTFTAKLPEAQQFFTWNNALWLAAVLGITKVIHEFGHGLTCKHFGGECHEMGVMLLVFAPALYCNVSDSTMLPNKWQRAAIGAAGMAVELLLAAIATFVWWFSQPGTVHHLALNVMFVCSVSTLLFNANPLMRYDGYFILSDLVEIPNLAQRAGDVLRRKLSDWCLGIRSPAEPFLPRRRQGLFAAYTIASAVYRWVIALAIFRFLYTFLEPQRLKVLGQGLALVSLGMLVGVPLYKLVRFFWTPGRLEQVNRMRFTVSLSLVVCLLAATLFIPLPHSVLCTLDVEPRDAASVYIDAPGKLVALHVRPGEKVEAGQVLAELENPDVALEMAELLGQRDDIEAQLKAVQRQRFADKKIGSQAPELKKSLDSLDDQIAQKRREHERLVLRAPQSGVVIPPPEVSQQEDDHQLSGWSGTPLETKNLGAFLQRSVLFCRIGPPGHYTARLVVDQGDVELIRHGLTVDLKLDQLPHDTFRGTIQAVSNHELKYTPQQLSSKTGGELATRTDAHGRERPIGAVYEASVPLDDAEGVLRVGLRGRARIHTNWRTVGERIARYVSQTFHFQM